MKAKELGLIEPALSGAIELEFKFPGINFTSGRRTMFSQAKAMAQNVLEDRNWIRVTYRSHPVTDACQAFVDAHPDATMEDLFNGFLGVMNSYTDAQLASWSHHLAGLAFDVEPETERGDAIKTEIRNLPGLNLFLEREGNLLRWHAQFNPLPSGGHNDGLQS